MRPASRNSAFQRPIDCSDTFSLRAASAIETSPARTLSTILVFFSAGITGGRPTAHLLHGHADHALITGLPRSLERDTWTHDTAITLRGLVATGHRAEADRVLEALLRLAGAVRGRFPELIAGDAVGTQAVPYPASCRPQAWAAASAAAMASAAVGLDVDVPAGQVRLSPSATLPPTWALHGALVAGEPLRCDAGTAG